VIPLLVVLALAPVVVMVSLLAVAFLATPSLLSLVAQRRFPLLERKQGGSFLWSVAWSLGHFVGFRCAHPFHALVADPALGFDIATLDLGLADLSGDGF
jgi:hypothetical protein